MEDQSVSWDLNHWRCCIQCSFPTTHVRACSVPTCVTRIILFIYIWVNQTNVVVPVIVKADAQNPAPMNLTKKRRVLFWNWYTLKFNFKPNVWPVCFRTDQEEEQNCQSMKKTVVNGTVPQTADKGVLPDGRRSIIPCAELVKVG